MQIRGSIIETPLVVANWKMNALNEKTRETLTNIILNYGENGNVTICPPFTALRPLGYAFESTKLKLGAQDCHFEDRGAYTGEISAEMVKLVGCSYVIVGHSERRQYHFESDEMVRKKAEAAIRNKLVPIICIGETAEQRNAGTTLEVIEAQLKACLPKDAKEGNCVLAYEPVWAIGTGNSASLEDIEAAHAFIKEKVAEILPESGGIHTLYGGSVKAANASKIMRSADVSGVLVGSASLDANEFQSIVDIAVLISQEK